MPRQCCSHCNALVPCIDNVDLVPHAKITGVGSTCTETWKILVLTILCLLALGPMLPVQAKHINSFPQLDRHNKNIDLKMNNC